MKKAVLALLPLCVLSVYGCEQSRPAKPNVAERYVDAVQRQESVPTQPVTRPAP